MDGLKEGSDRQISGEAANSTSRFDAVSFDLNNFFLNGYQPTTTDDARFHLRLLVVVSFRFVQLLIGVGL